MPGDGAGDGRPIIVFDGVCNLCDGLVRFVLARDRRRRFRFAANQSPAGRRLLGDTATEAFRRTLFLVDGEHIDWQSTAVLRIARGLGLPWSLAWIFVLVPRPIRDALYRFVARRRYRWFGRRDECRLPLPSEIDRFVTD